jgi:endo-1,4-beta-xylanase
MPDNVELLYNDFNMTLEGKRNAVVSMINDFKARGIRIDGVGIQAHWKLTEPSITAIEQSILEFHAAGVDVHITELDIDVLPPVEGMFGDGNGESIRGKVAANALNDPYREGLPQDMQEKFAARYGALFRLFVKHSEKIKRVTFWGVADHKTWLDNWPIRGRTNHPLLFDRDLKPKPAFYSVLEQGWR